MFTQVVDGKERLRETGSAVPIGAMKSDPAPTDTVSGSLPTVMPCLLGADPGLWGPFYLLETKVGYRISL
jgi:hypothetical protein